jgi:molybdate transport system substrate-binding protein
MKVFKKVLTLLIAVVTISFLAGCNDSSKEESSQAEATKPQLLIQCGITMVRPITEIAKIIEQQENCTITITQDGSKDLYSSIKATKTGDIYFPGSDSFVKKGLEEGMLVGKGTHVGYNKAAIFVQKGNPLNITNDLKNFLDPKYKTVLCNPESGSIGKMSKKIFTKAKIFNDAYDATMVISTDSRDINKYFFDKSADLSINWYATSKWDDNKKYIDTLDIDEKIAPRKRLELVITKYAKHPKIAQKFIDYAASDKGKAIFYKYGFWEDRDLTK